MKPLKIIEKHWDANKNKPLITAMLFIEILESSRIAVESIFSHKLKSLLSVLGVVIGISVVILMGWLVMSLDEVVEETFSMMGTDMLWVSRFSWAGGLTWEDMRNRKKITLKTAEEFARRIQGAKIVTINGSQWGNNAIKYNNDTYEGINLEGGDYNYQFTANGTVTEGRYFSSTELELGTNTIIIGDKVKETIFPVGVDPIGKRISIRGRHFVIIGVLKKQGTMMMTFIDNRVVIPLNTFLKEYGRDRDFDIGIKTPSPDKLDEVRYETLGLMRSLRNIKPGMKDDFSINESLVFEEQTKEIRIGVYAVGIGMTMLSFVVGIIGVMNIMFVSVTERTKEIGIRKAIGARSSSILLQFIIEPAILCFFGALLSLVICSVVIYIGSMLLSKYNPELSFLSSYIPTDLLIISSMISILVGIVAGLVPAVRASRLEPIDALRWE